MTKIYKYVNDFAGDKDVAARIRDKTILPAVAKGRSVTLDFEGVDLATQSFMHALLAQVVRDDPAVLDSIDFRNCNENVQSLIEIVVDYAQEDFAVGEE